MFRTFTVLRMVEVVKLSHDGRLSVSVTVDTREELDRVLTFHVHYLFL